MDVEHLRAEVKAETKRADGCRDAANQWKAIANENEAKFYASQGDVGKLEADAAAMREALIECGICVASMVVAEELHPGIVAPANLPKFKAADELVLKALALGAGREMLEELALAKEQIAEQDRTAKIWVKAQVELRDGLISTRQERNEAREDGATWKWVADNLAGDKFVSPTAAYVYLRDEFKDLRAKLAESETGRSDLREGYEAIRRKLSGVQPEYDLARKYRTHLEESLAESEAECASYRRALKNISCDRMEENEVRNRGVELVNIARAAIAPADEEPPPKGCQHGHIGFCTDCSTAKNIDDLRAKLAEAEKQRQELLVWSKAQGDRLALAERVLTFARTQWPGKFCQDSACKAWTCEANAAVAAFDDAKSDEGKGDA